MSNYYGSQASAYMGDVAEAASRASGAMLAVAVGWAAFPFAVQTAFFHPSNAIKLQFKLQGLPPPHAFTSQQLTAGCIEAVVALAVLALCQMVFTVFFYRWAKMAGKPLTTPALWPLAAVGVGVFGNAAWFYGTGVFDWVGCMIGLSSAVLTVIAQIVVNSLGREFVMGPANAAHGMMLPGAASPMQGPVSYYIPE
jgi:hypothetical protein